MKSLLRALVISCSLLIQASAQSTLQNSQSVIRRKAIARFVFEPKTSIMRIKFFESSGTKSVSTTSLELNAIGDQIERGRTVKGAVERSDRGTFLVTLGLPEGEWNIQVKAVVAGQPLEGLYLLGVGKYPVNGQFALVAANPEVSRLVWIVSLMLGIPVSLAVLLTVLSLVTRKQK